MTYGYHILQLCFKHTAFPQSAPFWPIPPDSPNPMPSSSLLVLYPCGAAGHNTPVEVFRGANRNDSVGVCEGGKNADPVYRLAQF